MAVVTYIENPSKELQPIYANAKSFFGHVPNLVKALGSNFAMCKSITNFMIQSLGEGHVNWAFKELVILKTLRVMKSHYSYGAHEQIARSLDVSESKIGDIANSIWRSSTHFSEGEKLVFELVEQIGIDANAVTADLWTELRKHWSDSQLVELNGVITTFIMIGRVGDTLGVSDPVLFTRDLH
ncbi:MAG: hypothetical protein OEQ81_08560 [Flavobacteriaceae bacterium]|nr:hypothetical protein [Flavobacteriaceae bacterium]